VRRPIVLVISEERELRDRLTQSLLNSNLVELAGDRCPDVVFLGCDESIAASTVHAARRMEGSRKIPIVLIACRGSEDLAVKAIRYGVSDYLRMPFSRGDLDSVLQSVRPTCKEAGLVNAERMIGQSSAIRAIKDYIAKAARTDSNVLITGETGTGKELIAELIHKNSARADRALVCVNCAAIPDSLLESELFGYERGAFTGAHASQDGKLKLADEGTLFLDEIGDMSRFAQAKVLRAIESREVQKLGARKPQSVNFRLIAATNRDLESVRGEDAFRRDLFFRLNVARIHLPPLRERKEDILPLSHFFRGQFDRKFGRQTTGFTAATEEILIAHSWQGNVRELKNMIEASFINLEPDATLVQLPAIFRQSFLGAGKVEATELDRMLAALAETQWNRSRAAEKLQWSRMTLYRKMSQYQVIGPKRETGRAQASTSA
jgi:DNA-binding NtrC family response regulator